MYRYIKQPPENVQQRGYVGALVLILLIFTPFALARLVARDRSRRKARTPRENK